MPRPKRTISLGEAKAFHAVIYLSAEHFLLCPRKGTFWNTLIQSPPQDLSLEMFAVCRNATY